MTDYFGDRHKKFIFVVEFLVLAGSPQPLLKNYTPFIALVAQTTNGMIVFYPVEYFFSWS